MTDSSSKQPTFQSQELSTSAIPAPPHWLCQIGYWFRIGFSLFLLLSVLIGAAGCSSSAATVPWREAAAVVPEAVIEQVIQTNIDMDVAQAKETLLAWTVDGKEGKLTLFNFNTPNLCGALGCLYTGYWLRENQSAVEVFQNYLNPNLPSNKPLFQVGEDRGQVLPCLKVLQMQGDSLRDGKAERLRQLNYCFNGDRYQLADSQLLSS
ncbi:MAG: hypothetical protein HC840_02045 [Leptolyngbyaceae cyanobacterium RM2_2_4]|nr:hypothetical protein [Leptolyngbyaceae cyanobacterium SM1_4_3]NJO48456.1 hypothetical protein [Leptolyngbyaceae cyanobacterium RM2_2_4]